MQQVKKGLEKIGHQVDILIREPSTCNCSLYESEKFVDHRWVMSMINAMMDGRIKREYPQLENETMLLEHEKSRYCFELSASLLNVNQYDIIHTQDVISSIAISRTISRHVLHVTTIHGILHHEWQRLGLASTKQTDRYGYYQEYYGATVSQKTIVPSYAFRDDLHIQYKIPIKQIEVVYNGFDTKRLLQKVNDCSSDRRQKIIIGCVARLKDGKGHECLLDALKKLKKSFKNWECWLIGDGPLRELLKQRCEQFGLLDQVVFWGELEDISPQLAMIDVMVLASEFESLSYATMEAQVAGKAVVVTNVGGLKEVVDHGKTGLLFPKNDSERLYQYLMLVMKNQNLRKYLGRNAQKKALSLWDTSTMTNHLVHIYENEIRKLAVQKDDSQ